MNDPHVAVLRYALISAPGITLDRAPDTEFETPEFTVKLRSNEIHVVMHEHHATEASARARVEPYLRAWALHGNLKQGRPVATAELRGSNIVDRAPNPGEIVESGSVGVKAMVSGKSTLDVGPFPEAPDGFALTPGVEYLYEKWAHYVSGRESLAAMAYFVHTYIQDECGGGDLAKAGRTLGVSNSVLRTLRRISGRHTTRKHDPAAEPSTPEEDNWLRAAVPRLIVRLGEVEADGRAHLPILTLDDFPSLSGT